MSAPACGGGHATAATPGAAINFRRLMSIAICPVSDLIIPAAMLRRYFAAHEPAPGRFVAKLPDEDDE
jgi:hypothetical protein